jgi:LysM repeat protein
MAPFDPSAHPRAAAGTASGGQFAPAGGSKPPAKKAAAKKTTAKKTTARKTAARKISKSVTVKKGDTLSAIARRNKVTLAQLKKDNPGLFTKAHRGGNLIFPGNKVKISSPVKKAAAKKTTAKKTVAKKAATTKRAATKKAASRK